MVILRESDGDEAAFHLLRENSVFQELGRKIITRYRGDKVCDVAALEELVQNPVLVDRFSAATAMNVAYRQRFAELMRSDPGRSELREMIVAALANFEPRSEEHTSELQSLMRISYAVFCLKKKNIKA